jgi:hypothetical protein
MNAEKVYKDSEGNDCTILQMVKREPEWAANRMQAGEDAIDELKRIKAELAKPEAEPVAWMDDRGEVVDNKWLKNHGTSDYRAVYTIPLYTSPLPMQRPYESLPRSPRFDPFIRAFWRRIHDYKIMYGKDLPEQMPVEFRASMETALLVFDREMNISTDNSDNETERCYDCFIGAACVHDKRPMQRLTDEEIAITIREANRNSAIKRDGSTSTRIARAIETALIEKNK